MREERNKGTKSINYSTKSDAFPPRDTDQMQSNVSRQCPTERPKQRGQIRHFCPRRPSNRSSRGRIMGFCPRRWIHVCGFGSFAPAVCTSGPFAPAIHSHSTSFSVNLHACTTEKPQNRHYSALGPLCLKTNCKNRDYLLEDSPISRRGSR